jgi:hypothetical protein
MGFMMLALFAFALAAAQDGGRDIPPPRPIPTELAATFAGAVRRTSAFAPAGGRAIQPAMQGILAPESPYPAWIVEFHWEEKGVLHSGVAMLVDVPAMEKVKPGTEKAIPRELREGAWVTPKVFEGQTFATWSEQMQEQRRSGNEMAALGTIRLVISGQVAFRSASGNYGEIRCLSQPADCIPGFKDPAMLDVALIPAEQFGYRRTFHPGAPVKGNGTATGLLATWAYAAVPLDPHFGSRSFCGDSTGAACAVAGGTMPPIVGGACPKACQPLP